MSLDLPIWKKYHLGWHMFIRMCLGHNRRKSSLFKYFFEGSAHGLFPRLTDNYRIVVFILFVEKVQYFCNFFFCFSRVRNVLLFVLDQKLDVVFFTDVSLSSTKSMSNVHYSWKAWTDFNRTWCGIFWPHITNFNFFDNANLAAVIRKQNTKCYQNISEIEIWAVDSSLRRNIIL